MTTPYIPKSSIDYSDIRSKFRISDNFNNSQIDTVLSISDRLHIPHHISLNLIYNESRFDSTVVSSAGCYGYMQLHPKYFTATTSYENLLQGLGFLRDQYDRLGTWEQAIIYYNSGETMYKDCKFVNYILTNGKDN
jgi:soluble lytic murein transglycosylase-like protein